MPLLVVGINHRTAPLEIRERVVFGPTRLVQALTDLRRDGGTSENLIVSTCNRTELYCYTENPGALSHWLEHYHGQPVSLTNSLYEHAEAAAVEHAFAVAAGLDSLPSSTRMAVMTPGIRNDRVISRRRFRAPVAVTSPSPRGAVISTTSTAGGGGFAAAALGPPHPASRAPAARMSKVDRSTGRTSPFTYQ